MFAHSMLTQTFAISCSFSTLEKAYFNLSARGERSKNGGEIPYETQQINGGGELL